MVGWIKLAQDCKWKAVVKRVMNFFNTFHIECIEQIHNIQITNKIHLNIRDLFYSQCSHQHVSAGIAAIFRVMLLLQE
jgi:hypothetical protein